eukprot:g6585.t1
MGSRVTAMVSVLVAFAGNGVHLSTAFMLQSGRHPLGGDNSAGSSKHRANFRHSIAARCQLSSCHWTLMQQQQRQGRRRRRRQQWEAALLQSSPFQRLQPRQSSRTARSFSGRTTTMAAAASTAAADQIGPGSMIVFETDVRGRAPMLGLVTDTSVGKKKSTYSVQPVGGGGKATVAPRQVRYVVPGGSRYEASDLATFEEQQDFDEELIEEAWDMMLEESTAAALAGVDGSGGEGAEAGAAAGAGSSSSLTIDDPRGMAELLFGSGEPTPQQCYHAYRLLEGRDGALYFKRLRDGTYECRSREAVELARHKLSLEDAAKAKKADFVAGLQAGLNEGGGYRKTPLVVEDFDEEQQEMLRGLEILAVQSVARTNFASTTSAEEALGRELLTLLGRSPNSANAFHLCVHLGLMKHHENLFAREAGIEKTFSDEAMAQARAMIDSPPPDPEASIRRDLTHLKAYAIDSEDTNEVDDGLSVETLPDGAGERIWVHIADVSRWVPEGSPLYEEARRRRTTIYLPEGAVPMFPPEVAHGVLSLRAGKESYSLSMGITLGERGDITDVVVTPALVKVTYRLTYDDVEDMLANGIASTDEWELGRLHKLAQLRHRYRCEQGSVDRFQKGPDHTIKAIESPSAPGGYDVKVTMEDPSSRSIRLVTEMMVLVGEGMGRIGGREGIPLPFRHQKPPDSFPEDELNSLPEKYCRAQGAYRYMSPATTATTPQLHWGLGLASYVQWSSPIRRYLDLLAHYQVKRWLAGQTPLDGSVVMAQVEAGDGAVQTANRVMRKTNKYWVTEYLSKLQGSDLEAYVVSYRDTRDKGGKVLYNLLLLGLGVTLPYVEAGLSLELGELVFVRVLTSSSRNLFTKISWRRMSAKEKSAVEGRLGDEAALAGPPGGAGVASGGSGGQGAGGGRCGGTKAHSLASANCMFWEECCGGVSII